MTLALTLTPRVLFSALLICRFLYLVQKDRVTLVVFDGTINDVIPDCALAPFSPSLNKKKALLRTSFKNKHRHNFPLPSDLQQQGQELIQRFRAITVEHNAISTSHCLALFRALPGVPTSTRKVPTNDSIVQISCIQCANQEETFIAIFSD